MQKLTDLHNYLLQELAPLNLRPESVKAYADEGTVKYYQGDENQNFKLRYDATIAFFDTSLSADQVAYVLVLWVKQNQPHREDEIKFTAEITSATQWDIVFSVPMEETVVAQTQSDAINLARSENAAFLKEPAYDATLEIGCIHDPSGPPDE